MLSIDELFTRYGTDKGSLGGAGWGYHTYYEKLMGPRRFDVKRVLEIGICGHRDIPNNVVGASLFCWRDYFPNATIYGIDNDSRFVFNDQHRITTCLANAYSMAQMVEVMEQLGGDFDMIVDDAVHDPVPQIWLMNFLSSYLRKGGYYFMEDVCPVKMVDGDVDRGLFDHIRGYEAILSLKTPKPEVLVVGIK